MSRISDGLKALITEAGGTPPETDNIGELVSAFSAVYSGGAGEPYTLPAATTSAIGGVKKAAVTPQVAAADAVAAEADTPTKAEFDAIVTLANELKDKLNSVINAQRAAGQAADE